VRAFSFVTYSIIVIVLRYIPIVLVLLYRISVVFRLPDRTLLRSAHRKMSRYLITYWYFVDDACNWCAKCSNQYRQKVTRILGLTTLPLLSRQRRRPLSARRRDTASPALVSCTGARDEGRGGCIVRRRGSVTWWMERAPAETRLMSQRVITAMAQLTGLSIASSQWLHAVTSVVCFSRCSLRPPSYRAPPSDEAAVKRCDCTGDSGSLLGFPLDGRIICVETIAVAFH